MSSRPSSTYSKPRPRAHTPTSKPRNRRNPTTPCNPAPYPPQPPRTRTRNTSNRNPTAPPRPRRPPPEKDIYATVAGTLAHPMDAEQYYQSVYRELPADQATLQEWRQERGGNNERGPEDDLLWEDTWKGTMDTFLEAAAATYPRPPRDIRHGLHALLAFHSSKHRHTITLHPLDHNPHRWTPEDDATAAITIQQDPGNQAGHHVTWNDRAQHPPASPTLHDVFATISAELQEAKAPQQPDDRMPQEPSPPTAQKSPHQEPLTRPVSTMEPPRITLDRNWFRNLPREWAVHNGKIWCDEIIPGLQAIRLQSITEPTTTWTLPTDRDHLLLTVEGDAAVTPTERDPITAAPAHAVHVPPQASSAPMTVHPGPGPWQAIVIT